MVTAVTVANVIELVSAVVHEVAGNEISNQLNNSPLTREAVGQLVMARINQNFKSIRG